MQKVKRRKKECRMRIKVSDINKVQIPAKLLNTTKMKVRLEKKSIKDMRIWRRIWMKRR